MKSKYLLESTMLNYMNIVLSVIDTFEQDYVYQEKTPSTNFYVKHYKIDFVKNEMQIVWSNINDAQHFIIFRKPKYNSEFLNKLYFFFHPEISVSDKSIALEALKHVIYPDFCKDLQLVDTDFSEFKTSFESANAVMCSLYRNFFNEIPVDRFIDAFKLRDRISVDAVRYIEAHCCQSSE